MINMMNETDLPFGNIESTFRGLGTAPALESIELGDDVPIAINPTDIAREATRYIFYAGDTIPAQQKADRPDLRLGGEYFAQEYKCLIRSKGLVRRCQITPMEIGFEFMSDNVMGDNATNLQVVSQVTHDTPGHAPSKLNAIRVYPGEEIRGLLRGDSNRTNKGFVELKGLAGVDYADYLKLKLQEFVFPNWTAIANGVESLPDKLAPLVTHLESRRAATTDADLKAVVEDMLRSCDIYRRWGTQYVKFSSALVRIPAHQGHVNTYSEQAEMLMYQLDLRREDMLMDAGQREMVERANSGNITSEDAQALLKMLAENQQVLMQMMQGNAPKVKTVKAEKTEAEVIPSAEPTELDPTKCSAITGSGKQCTGEADETGRCKHPAHRL